MQINDAVQAYPVLRENNSTYDSGSFEMEVYRNDSDDDNPDDGNLNFTVSFDLQEPSLQAEIDCGNAVFVAHVECPTSYYRRIYQSSERQIPISVPAIEINYALEISGFILTTKALNNFAPNNLKPIARGLTFEVPLAAFLATTRNKVVELDREPNPIKRVDAALFVGCGVEGQKHIGIKVEDDRIQISMSPDDYAQYEQIKDSVSKESTIRMGIVVPALASVVSRLTLDSKYREDCSGWAWYRAFSQRSREIDRGEISDWLPQDALEIAQELVGDPIKKFLEESISDLED